MSSNESGTRSVPWRSPVLRVVLRGSAAALGRTLGPLLFAGLAWWGGYRPLLLLAGVGALVFGAAVLALSR